MDETQNLSKAERKRLKLERRREEKERRQKEWLRERRKGKLKFWWKIGLVLAAVAVGSVYWVSTGPRISITPSEYSFGQVSVRGGTVNTTFTVKNNGKGDLIIKKMETSCMCTTATLVVNGIEGPKFGMQAHGNPTGWEARIPPGGEAQLKVYYDPTVHRDFRGPVTRKISVYSNAPFSWTDILTVRAEQVG